MKKWFITVFLLSFWAIALPAQAPMEQSRKAFEEGNYESAAQVCELAQDRVTDASEKRFLSTLLTMCRDCIRYRDEGERLFQSGYYAEALTCYSRLLSLNPQDAFAAGRYRMVTAEVEKAKLESERALAVTTWTPASFRRFADLYPSHEDTPAFLVLSSLLSGGPMGETPLSSVSRIAREFGMTKEVAALYSRVASSGSPDALYELAQLSDDADRDVLLSLAWAAGAPEAAAPKDTDLARSLYDALLHRDDDPSAALTLWQNRSALACLSGVDAEASLRKMLKEGKLESVDGGTAYRLGQAAIQLDVPAFAMMDAAALKGNLDALEWLSIHHPSVEERTYIRKAYLSDEREPYFQAWNSYLHGQQMSPEDWALMAAYLQQNEPQRRDDILLALSFAVTDGDSFKALKKYSEEGTFSSGIQAVLASRLAGRNDKNASRVLKLLRGMKNISEGPYEKYQSRYLNIR